MLKKRFVRTGKKIRKASKRVWQFTKRAARFTRTGVSLTWAKVRSTTRRVLLLILVGAIVYAGSGLFYVPANGIGYLQQGYSARSIRLLPYQFYEGPWWAPATLTRNIIVTNHDFPTTDDFIRMAYYYDGLHDTALGARQEPLNPRGDTEVERMATLIVAYLRQMPDTLDSDFEFNGVEFFEPDASVSSRYEVEIAHWSRILSDPDTGMVIYDEDGLFITDARVHVNMAAMASLTSSGRSFMVTLTHELVHGALQLTLPPTGESYYDQEALDQMVTAQVLYNMMQDGVDGADIAFYEHMSELAMYSAMFRARFGTDELATSYYSNLRLGAMAEYTYGTTANIPTVWQATPWVDYTVDRLAELVEVIKGNPYAKIPEVQGHPLAATLINSVRTTVMLIRQNGIHIRPDDILQRIFPANFWAEYVIPIEQRIWGRGYPYVDYTLLEGELERAERANDEIFGVSSSEGQEMWRINNTYFYSVWAKYEYCPLTTIIGNVNYGFPITWWGMTSSDLNMYLYMYLGMVNPNDVFTTRSIDFQNSTWEQILAPLGLDERELPTADGDCIRAGGQGPCIAVSTYDYEFGTWRPFPIIPILFALVLALDAWVLRRWGTRRLMVERADKVVARPPVKLVGKIMTIVGQALERWGRQ